MKAYMVYSREIGSGEAAYLVFAHSVQEARVVGWDGELTDEWIDLAATLMKDSNQLFEQADQSKLKADRPHCIDSPITCKGCNLWGYWLNEKGYCETCYEDI